MGCVVDKILGVMRRTNDMTNTSKNMRIGYVGGYTMVKEATSRENANMNNLSGDERPVA